MNSENSYPAPGGQNGKHEKRNIHCILNVCRIFQIFQREESEAREVGNCLTSNGW